jgi:hypothetical protein
MTTDKDDDTDKNNLCLCFSSVKSETSVIISGSDNVFILFIL